MPVVSYSLSRARKSCILRSIKTQSLPVHGLVERSLAKTFSKTCVARIAFALLFSSVDQKLGLIVKTDPALHTQSPLVLLCARTVLIPLSTVRFNETLFAAALVTMTYRIVEPNSRVDSIDITVTAHLVYVVFLCV